MRLPYALLAAATVTIGLAGCTNTSNTPTNAPAPTTTNVPNTGTQTQADTDVNTQAPKATEPVQSDKLAVQKKHVELIFSDDNLMTQYKETHSISYEKEEDLPLLALKAWQKGPKSHKLVNLLPANVEIQSVKKDGNTAIVSLSSNVKQAANLGSTGEQFLMEQIATIMNQFGFKNTKIVLDGQATDTLLGHMDASTPTDPLTLSDVPQIK
ncbi:sporulation and spore germination protein [Aneurinibacillus soli]|uniref:Sporulation and spore germination n=1 Tax=Aneurinibacillus soli TaxID=1500254 RepID=A0A0U5B3K0_9BACL|nr:GerMN domain-containing protein [Aneurinibacillus soli]PYE58203.1 sporulation and spore germination protein [Aneurinibacillus soli]BAU27919.1 Sporulation and spore germination [Aneurinibacillus soli]